MKMKRMLALILTGIMALSLLTGCGGDKAEEAPADDAAAETEEAAE